MLLLIASLMFLVSLMFPLLFHFHCLYIYRERDAETDRQTDRQPDRPTDRQTDIQTDRTIEIRRASSLARFNDREILKDRWLDRNILKQ